eukprot:228501-Amorphochlora_amoeboformis.AAC.1
MDLERGLDLLRDPDVTHVLICVKDGIDPCKIWNRGDVLHVDRRRASQGLVALGCRQDPCNTCNACDYRFAGMNAGGSAEVLCMQDLRTRKPRFHTVEGKATVRSNPPQSCD